MTSSTSALEVTWEDAQEALGMTWQDLDARVERGDLPQILHRDAQDTITRVCLYAEDVEDLEVASQRYARMRRRASITWAVVAMLCVLPTVGFLWAAMAFPKGNLPEEETMRGSNDTVYRWRGGGDVQRFSYRSPQQVGANFALCLLITTGTWTGIVGVLGSLWLAAARVRRTPLEVEVFDEPVDAYRLERRENVRRSVPLAALTPPGMRQTARNGAVVIAAMSLFFALMLAFAYH